MDADKPLTEEEVKQLILTFWKLDEQKAHLVDLMEITAPDLEISMGEFAWHGYRGLEDYQMGSKDISAPGRSDARPRPEDSPECLELDFSPLRAKGIDTPSTSMPQK